jgi:hypothetical protein
MEVLPWLFYAPGVSKKEGQPFFTRRSMIPHLHGNSILTVFVVHTATNCS